MTANILYLTDTLCGWCNIARPVINKLVAALPDLRKEFGTGIDFEMLHVRLFVDDYVPEVSEAMVERARHVGFKAGPRLTGQQFSEAYIELLQTPGYRHDSHLSSLGFAAVSRLSDNDTAWRYAETLQSRVYDHGEAASDKATLLRAANILLEAHSDTFSLADFEAALDASETLALALKTAEQGAAWMEKADVSGAPALLLIDAQSDEAIPLDPYRAGKNVAMIQELLAAS